MQAGTILLINPDNLLVGDQLKAATVTLATGASVIAGTAVGNLIEDTPIYAIPEVGPFVQPFASVLVSGLLSCTLLIMLENPIKGLWFGIFVLALQQLDGNLIEVGTPM